MLVTIDADGQHDPGEIPAVAMPVLKGEADVSIGSRPGSSVPALRRHGNMLLDKITDSSIADTQSGFRAYSRKAFERITPAERGMGADSEILMEASALGMKVVEVPVSVDYGVPNSSKVNPAYHFLDVVASVIKVVSIRHPLIFYGIPGLALVLTSTFFFFRSLAVIGWVGVVTNLAMTYGLLAMGFLLFGLLTAYTGVILFTLTTLFRKSGVQDQT